MTTLYKKNVRCAVCGTESNFTDIASTGIFGMPDLDTRPPEMQRSTIFALVQRCPESGYCASDISKASEKANTMIHNPEYMRQLIDKTYPELANSFLCMALIHEALEDYTAAAWAIIHAAWACDDAEKTDEARTCRAKAVDIIKKAVANGQKFAGQDGIETTIRVDLLRRAGRVAEARQMIAEKRDVIKEEIILKILAFEDDLLLKGDEECHTIDEVIGENG